MRLRRQNTDDPRVEHDLDVLAGSYASGRETAPVAEAPPAPPRKGWRRDNGSDPRVLADLDLLAAHDAGTLPPPEPPEGDDDPMHDPFVRRFMGGAEHVRGHAKYYGALAAWLLLMFAVVPVAKHNTHDGAPDDSGVTTEAAAIGAPTTSTTALEPVTAPAPSISDVSSPMSTFTAAAAPSIATTSPSSITAAPVTTAPLSTTVAAAPFLTIARSGYASSSAGTPLEKDPADGALPVEAAGGQATKRSFVALRGSGTILHLEVTDGAVGEGSVAACPLSRSDWSTDRGQSMPGPAFSTTCAIGTMLDDGSWVFDLEQFGDPTAGAGFALTPMAGTFSLAFSPAALPPA